MSNKTSIGVYTRLSRLMKYGIRHLPCRLRRIVFIGFVLSSLSANKNPDANIIKRVNDSFKLANNPKAYEFPIAVKSIVWNDFDIDSLTIETQIVNGKKILTPECKVSLCYHITTHIPDWLRYASPQRVYTDVMVMIDTLEKSDNFIYST